MISTGGDATVSPHPDLSQRERASNWIERGIR
jgi:hypothetical protein